MKWLTTLILVVIVAAYAIVGALIFSYLEAGAEETQRESFYSQLNAFLSMYMDYIRLRKFAQFIIG